MEHDANLAKMRYMLVPKLISEENFWRNYFYRVSLVCEVNGGSCMVSDNVNSSLDHDPDINSSRDKTDSWEKELDEELESYEQGYDVDIENESKSLEEELEEAT
ncbi:BSD domain [Popillia japonica]|uniref:BSD domain n=1 Tax=Popillia japonica TaxID=7064 RepID=A0AAW1IFK9_POPJA